MNLRPSFMCIVFFLAVVATFTYSTPAQTARLVDEYGSVVSNLEWQRLDQYFMDLANNPNALGYVVVFGKNNKDRAAREQRVRRFTKFRRFDSSRLVFIKEIGRPKTQLWLVPPGASFPPT